MSKKPAKKLTNLEWFIEEFEHFCECGDFENSALDTRAIVFFNTFAKKLMKLAKSERTKL